MIPEGRTCTDMHEAFPHQSEKASGRGRKRAERCFIRCMGRRRSRNKYAKGSRGTAVMRAILRVLYSQHGPRSWPRALDRIGPNALFPEAAGVAKSGLEQIQLRMKVGHVKPRCGVRLVPHRDSVIHQASQCADKTWDS